MQTTFRYGRLPPLLILLLSLLLPFAVTAAATGPIQQTTSVSSSSSWGTAFPRLRWLRDSAVELIFGSSKSKDATATNWAAVHKQYRDHVVVRYNVTNQAEEQKLREAVDMFFLDVWAITPEYVDVGLSRNKLGPLKAWLPKSLHEPFVVVEDVPERVWATYPNGKRFGEGRIGGRERGGIEEWEEMVERDVVGRREDGVDNMFFRNYQPLSVGHQKGYRGLRSNGN
jgi:extracellular matrix protein 14